METLVWQKIPCLREELYIQLVITYHILKQEKKTESEKSLEEKKRVGFCFVLPVLLFAVGWESDGSRYLVTMEHQVGPLSTTEEPNT